MRCEGGRTQHKWHFPVEREITGDVTAPCLRVARENRDEQGSVCPLPRQAASAWVAFLYSEKVGRKNLCEVKDRSGFAAFFLLTE